MYVLGSTWFFNGFSRHEQVQQYCHICYPPLEYLIWIHVGSMDMRAHRIGCLLSFTGLRVVRAAMAKKRNNQMAPDPIQAALLKARVRTMRCLDKANKRNAPEETEEAEG